MRVMITGATGFAGSYLVDRLLGEGHYVTGLVHPSTGHQPVPKHARFRKVQGDLLDSTSLSESFKESKPELVFHLAGQASPSRSWEEPALTLAVNTGGTANLLKGALSAGSPRVILVTSADLYGLEVAGNSPVTEETMPRPDHPYGVSKLAAGLLGHLFWRKYGLPVVEARPFNHIGPRQAKGFVVPDFASQLAAIKRGEREPVLMVGNLEAQRDFTDVRDVAKAYTALGEFGRPGESYLICSGVATSVQTILDILIKLAGVTVEVKQEGDRYRTRRLEPVVGSYAKVARDTGWRPEIPLQKTLEDTFAYWMARGDDDRI